jgi:hypothetical protein
VLESVFLAGTLLFFLLSLSGCCPAPATPEHLHYDRDYAFLHDSTKTQPTPPTQHPQHTFSLEPALTNDQVLYFYYPETANLSLEEIDSLFMTKGAKGGTPSPANSGTENESPTEVKTATQTWENKAYAM